jgi:hypothetical protein
MGTIGIFINKNKSREFYLLTPRCATAIRGNSRADVEAACRKIYHIVQTNRNTIRPTHFVGIPVDSEKIRESFDQFKVFNWIEKY